MPSNFDPEESGRPPGPDSMPFETLDLRDITKHYPGVVALDRVDLSLSTGQVHGLVGENGAGKSTLLKVLAGATRADGGTLTWQGRGVGFRTPRDALALGITVIYQEPSLVPDLPADANVFLGIEAVRRGLLDRQQMRTRARQALESLGSDLDPAVPVRRLSIAQRQLVELARALVRDARVIALDEPTASLTPREVDHLFQQIATLKARGVALVFVSHRLDEVRRIADQVTVLRDGRRVWTGSVAEHDDAGLIRLMVGRAVEYTRQPPNRQPGPPLLEVRSLTRAPWFSDVSLVARAGEIVGLAGLVGAGRSELARCLAGVERWHSGKVAISGAPYRPRTPAEAIGLGVAYLSEDRQRDGLVLGMNVRENVTLPVIGRFIRRGRLRRDLESDATAEVTTAVGLRPPDPERTARTLSGGNQQKVLLGRWLLSGANVVLFDEPTRGVDVGAKVELHRHIRALADQGRAVIVISSELPEIMALADRVIVLREGRVTGELAGSALTAVGVMALAVSAA